MSVLYDHKAALRKEAGGQRESGRRGYDGDQSLRDVARN
jgi:hypothetical protein